MLQTKTYTPEQVAQILQLSKNTVYDLINKGEIIAKKFGKVYRIPESSLSFVKYGLDEDILSMQMQDEKTVNENEIESLLKKTRSNLFKNEKKGLS